MLQRGLLEQGRLFRRRGRPGTVLDVPAGDGELRLFGGGAEDLVGGDGRAAIRIEEGVHADDGGLAGVYTSLAIQRPADHDQPNTL